MCQREMRENEQIHRREILCKSALHKLKRKLPYGWDLNLYRGCAHGCRYCYAIDSHDYLSGGDFARDIYVKSNILDCLERELHASRWKREVVNIGGVTDSYQPFEQTCRLMPEVLRLFIRTLLDGWRGEFRSSLCSGKALSCKLFFAWDALSSKANTSLIF